MYKNKFRKVKKYFAERGLKIINANRSLMRELSNIDDLHPAPFGERLSIVDWEKKILWLADGYLNAMGIIHDAGHILASRKDPTLCEETSFLGWEYLTAKRLDVFDEWLKGHHDYYIYENGFDTIGALVKNKREMTKFFRKMVLEGTIEGNITTDGKPVSIR